MEVLKKHKSFSDLFPPPAYLLLSNEGIAVSDEDIKLAQIKRTFLGKELRVTHLKVADGVDKVSLLKGLSSRYGLKFAKAILPEEKAYLFTVAIDKVSKEDMHDAVAFVIEENVPISLSEAVFDYEVIGDFEDGEKLLLAVTVFSKSVVDSHIEIFESAGITPVSFDMESRALARVIVPKGDEATQLIVNLAPDKTGFYVVDKGIVQFSTTHSGNLEGDEHYKDAKSLHDDLLKVIGFWEEREVNRFGEEYKKKIKKVLVTGSRASDREFVDEFMRDTDLPFSVADVWANVPFKNGYAREMPFDESLEFAPVIGLVLPKAKR